MQLFDTRTGTTSPFVGGHTVRLYACGITPYDSTHLGHAFTYTVFDALVRYLTHLGHRVIYARNVTDVDDDILRKARELGEPYDQLARREVVRFKRDLAGLNLLAPHVEPWATATVEAIVRAVRGLIAHGAAYRIEDGRVYFDTRGGQRWGALQRLDPEERSRQFAEKGGDPDAAGKRHPLDFLLWQPSEADEPAWDSPWGPGRPGWHIECSVMAQEHLGPVIDIHGGGRDLVFPHHEAEMLQAEALTGQAPFARFWVHTGMVGLDGEKMAKSVGNLVFVGDLLERHEGGGLRRYLLQQQYRQDWSFDDAELDEASAAFKRWREAAGSDGERPDLASRFHTAMADDLDTPAALAVLDEAAEVGAGRTLRDLAQILGFVLIP